MIRKRDWEGMENICPVMHSTMWSLIEEIVFSFFYCRINLVIFYKMDAANWPAVIQIQNHQFLCSMFNQKQIKYWITYISDIIRLDVNERISTKIISKESKPFNVDKRIDANGEEFKIFWNGIYPIGGAEIISILHNVIHFSSSKLCFSCTNCLPSCPSSSVFLDLFIFLPNQRSYSTHLFFFHACVWVSWMKFKKINCLLNIFFFNWQLNLR